MIETARTLTNPQFERLCLDVLAAATLGLGDAQTALKLSQQAVTRSRITGHQFFEAVSLTDAAVATRRLGRVEEALALHEEARRLIEETGEQQYAVGVLKAYGDTCLLAGDFAAAEQHLSRALEFAAALDMPALTEDVRQAIRLLRAQEAGTPA